MDRRLFRDLLILIAVIIFAAIGARILARGETLADYARQNNKDAVAQEDVPKEDLRVTDSTDEPVISHNDNSERAKEVTAQDKEVTTENMNTTSVSETQTVSASEQSSEAFTPDAPSDRVVYQDGFYYEPVSDDVYKRIAGISYPTDCTVPLTDLRYVVLQYIDFDGNTQSGEMICGTSIAQDVVEIFHELYMNGYQIQSIKLVDEFAGDDTASMLANNTSCFNYRVVEGTTRLSNHAKGLAIDLNPFYNPYITYGKDGSVKISPEGSEPYADRSAAFPYKIDENDLAYKLFKEHGFTWGGNWNSSKDYQHFEKK